MHSIKKHMWFLETAAALLEGDDYTEKELMSTMAKASFAASAHEYGAGSGMRTAGWEPALEMDARRRRSVGGGNHGDAR